MAAEQVQGAFLQALMRAKDKFVDPHTEEGTLAAGAAQVQISRSVEVEQLGGHSIRGTVERVLQCITVCVAEYKVLAHVHAFDRVHAVCAFS